MWIENGLLRRPPPKLDGRFFTHPAFQFVAGDGLAQVPDSRAWEESHQPRRLAPRSSRLRGTVHCQVAVESQARFSGASGRSALRHHPDPFGRSSSRRPTPRPYPPSLHGRYPLLRSYEGSDPDWPFGRQPWFPDSRHLNFQPFHLHPSAALLQTRSTPSALGALFCSGFAFALAGSPEPHGKRLSAFPRIGRRRGVVRIGDCGGFQLCRGGQHG